MYQLQFNHQTRNNRRESAHGYILNSPFTAEQRPIELSRDDADTSLAFGLYPGWIEKVIEDAIECEHTKLVRLDEIQCSFIAIGRNREDSQFPSGNEKST